MQALQDSNGSLDAAIDVILNLPPPEDVPDSSLFAPADSDAAWAHGYGGGEGSSRGGEGGWSIDQPHLPSTSTGGQVGGPQFDALPTHSRQQRPSEAAAADGGQGDADDDEEDLAELLRFEKVVWYVWPKSLLVSDEQPRTWREDSRCIDASGDNRCTSRLCGAQSRVPRLTLALVVLCADFSCPPTKARRRRRSTRIWRFFSRACLCHNMRERDYPTHSTHSTHSTHWLPRFIPR